MPERSPRGGQTPGMDGAKKAKQMQNAAQKGHDQSSNLQPLPGRNQSLPPEPIAGRMATPVNLPRSSSPLPPAYPPHQAALVESILLGQSSKQFSDAAPVTPTRPTPPSPVPVLDNLQLRIVNGAMELRAARKDSMEVVIRPDTQTEMVLHLSRQNGLVDVEARMQRGDVGTLTQQWSQLQHSLAQQGIRLNALQSPEGPQNHFSEHFSQSNFHKEQHSPHEQEESMWTPSRPETLPDRRASTLSATLQSAKGSFESWA